MSRRGDDGTEPDMQTQRRSTPGIHEGSYLNAPEHQDSESGREGTSTHCKERQGRGEEAGAGVTLDATAEANDGWDGVGILELDTRAGR